MIIFRKKFKDFILSGNQEFSTGFTLVELLVVIGIIALLSSLATVVAREARDRGRDTRIKTSLAQVRFEAAMIHNEDKSYANLCDGGSLNDTDYENLNLLEVDIRKYSGLDPNCHATTDAYCVASLLVTDPTLSHCIDSTGFAGNVSSGDCEGTIFDCASP